MGVGEKEWVWVNGCVNKCVCVHVCVCAHMCACVCGCVCVCMCSWVLINNTCERNYVTIISGRRLQPTNLDIVLVHGYRKVCLGEGGGVGGGRDVWGMEEGREGWGDGWE